MGKIPTTNSISNIIINPNGSNIDDNSASS